MLKSVKNKQCRYFDIRALNILIAHKAIIFSIWQKKRLLRCNPGM